MANVAHPGFHPSRMSGTGGGTVTYARRRNITNNTNIIATGDAVIVDANGDTLTATVTTTAVDSVAMGSSYVDTTGARLGRASLPAATLYTSTGNAPDNMSFTMVVDNPVNVDFRCSLSAVMTLTKLVSQNYAMVLTASANGISKHNLDGTTNNTTSTLPWRFVSLIDSPDNDPDLANVHIYAKINRGMSTPALTDGTGI